MHTIDRCAKVLNEFINEKLKERFGGNKNNAVN